MPMRLKLNVYGNFLIAGRVKINADVAIRKSPKTVTMKLTRFMGSSKKLNPNCPSARENGTMLPAHDME